MLKRFGVLAMVLTAGAALIQPVAAMAEDRVPHERTTVIVRHDNDDRGRFDRGRDRYERRVVVVHRDDDRRHNDRFRR
jgi:hypothetical protein